MYYAIINKSSNSLTRHRPAQTLGTKSNNFTQQESKQGVAVSYNLQSRKTRPTTFDSSTHILGTKKAICGITKIHGLVRSTYLI